MFDTVSVSGSQGLPLAQSNASAAFFTLVGANTGGHLGRVAAVAAAAVVAAVR